MITQNDLLDLKFVLCNIRIDPSYEKNEPIVQLLIKEFKSPLNCDNKLRVALSQLDLLDNENWQFVYHMNIYPYIVAIKNEEVYRVLEMSFRYLLSSLQQQDTAKVAAVADVLHNLPIGICENSYRIPKWFYKREVKSFRKNWDKKFLTMM